jgi:hypothetical protein
MSIETAPANHGQSDNGGQKSSVWEQVSQVNQTAASSVSEPAEKTSSSTSSSSKSDLGKEASATTGDAPHLDKDDNYQVSFADIFSNPSDRTLGAKAAPSVDNDRARSSQLAELGFPEPTIDINSEYSKSRGMDTGNSMPEMRHFPSVRERIPDVDEHMRNILERRNMPEMRHFPSFRERFPDLEDQIGTMTPSEYRRMLDGIEQVRARFQSGDPEADMQRFLEAGQSDLPPIDPGWYRLAREGSPSEANSKMEPGTLSAKNPTAKEPDTKGGKSPEAAASQHTVEGMINFFQENFEKIDTDGDGNITRAEIAEQIKKPGSTTEDGIYLSAMYSNIPLWMSATQPEGEAAEGTKFPTGVTRESLQAIKESLPAHSQQAVQDKIKIAGLENAFRHIDTNNDGCILESEVDAALKADGWSDEQKQALQKLKENFAQVSAATPDYRNEELAQGIPGRFYEPRDEMEM